MHNPFLINFTPEPSTPSGGVSLTGSTWHSNQLNWPTDQSAQCLEWSHIDRGTDGAVEFNTRITLTGDHSSLLSAASLQRLVCYYVVGHLPDDALPQACESLTDIFGWAMLPVSAEPAVPSEARKIKSVKTNKAERSPFVLGPD